MKSKGEIRPGGITMKPTSARSLLWLSFFLILLSGLGMAPPAALSTALLGAFFAVFPSLFAPGKLRIFGVLLLLLGLTLSGLHYPDFKNHMARYRQHAESRP